MTSTAPAPTTDRLVVERIIHVTPETVFALLSDPAKHHLTEPTDWVRDSLDPEPARISAVGDVFGIEMFHVNAGGRYEMHNVVIAIEQDRTLAWEPSSYMTDGTLQGGGWTWGYDLEPVPEGTRVRLIYDWSATPPEVAAEIGGLPSVGPEFLEQSLAGLAAALEGEQD